MVSSQILFILAKIHSPIKESNILTVPSREYFTKQDTNIKRFQLILVFSWIHFIYFDMASWGCGILSDE